MSRQLDKVIAPLEVIIRCLIRSHLNSNKTKVIYKTLEPKENQHDVSVMRLRYTDESFCINHGMSLTTPPSFAGLLRLNKTIVDGVNQWAKSGISVDDEDEPTATCNGISVEIKPTPLDANQKPIDDDVEVDVDANDGSYPMHADLLYNQTYGRDEHLNVRVMKYAKMLTKRTSYRLTNTIGGTALKDQEIGDEYYHKYSTHPKLSIIIPYEKDNRQVRLLAEKVLKQAQGKPVEVIFINDSSTDVTNLMHVLNQYPMEYEHYGQDKKGMSVARNHGVEVARGNYVWFLDLGTSLMEGAVDAVLDAVSKGDYEVLVFQGSDEIEGRNAKDNTRCCYNGDTIKECRGVDFILNHYSCSPAQLFIIRSDFMRDNGFTFEDSNLPDQLLLPRLLLSTDKMLLVPFQTCHFRSELMFSPERMPDILAVIKRYQADLLSTQDATKRQALSLLQLRMLPHVFEDPNRKQMLDNYRVWDMKVHIPIFRKILKNNFYQIQNVKGCLKWLCWFIGPKFYKWVEWRRTRIFVWK